ncbi:HK97 family phage prohead protease [Tardiphaga sp. vice352]|uniref:HK97 family phage prohead protease n=1 Tax=Tardiphaga sp. vice352 TaxID=2592816 RepID=UPI001161F30F|nr:HK97 family phage prohead protease [Tardiphaga sp. vice352]QDM32716.1 HK97 family phage prohead protease [Tardiphaga sp. vice352]
MDKLELKASLSVTDDGQITGNAWPFGSADSVGDIITKGAFGIILADLPILYQHNPADLVGTWTEATETEEGLAVKGQLHLDHPRARSVRAMLKSGLVSGLSIGFRTKAATKQGRNRIISALDLAEISLVQNPSHPRARINSIKSQSAALAVAELINRAAAALRKDHL